MEVVMVKAIILAAGLSSRMKPLTDNCPKPMLLLNGKPIMEYVINHLRKHGIVEIIITTHYFPHVIEDYFGDGSEFGVRIEYSHEKVLRNTAGSLKLAESLVGEEFLVCGGHFFLPSLNLGDLIRFHKKQGGIATIVFKNLNESNLLGFFGQGILDKDKRLIAFQEKPKYKLSHYVHTTYQIFKRDIFKFIPPKKFVSIPKFLIPRLLNQNLDVYGYCSDSELINLSNFELYARALKKIK